jgi:feruloyl esterase
LPAFCRVTITVEPQIKIEVWLPDGWNQRFRAADGTLNWQLIEDFASRSNHEMAKKAKAVIAACYGTPEKYSY